MTTEQTSEQNQPNDRPEPPYDLGQTPFRVGDRVTYLPADEPSRVLRVEVEDGVAFYTVASERPLEPNRLRPRRYIAQNDELRLEEAAYLQPGDAVDVAVFVDCSRQAQVGSRSYVRWHLGGEVYDVLQAEDGRVSYVVIVPFQVDPGNIRLMVTAQEQAQAHNLPDDLRELLAAYAHSAWSGWLAYQFKRSTRNDDGSVTIPADLVGRWFRQSTTPYDQLPDQERDSDRAEADRIMAIWRGRMAETLPPAQEAAPAVGLVKKEGAQNG